MPFTLAHAAAALPLHRLSGGRLPLAALVVGTLAPDLEYPWRLAAVGRLGHSASGLGWALARGWPAGPDGLLAEPDETARRRRVGIALAVVPLGAGAVLAGWSVRSLAGGRAVAGTVVQFAVGWMVGLGVCLLARGMATPRRRL